MKQRHFKGGIFPESHKGETAARPVIVQTPPKRLYFPLMQPFGVTAEPVVKVGDYVLRGQMLAEGHPPFGVPLHSSVSGRVAAVELHQHLNGDLVKTVMIENDGRELTVPPLMREPLSHMTRRTVTELIKRAGIIGLGGAGFPTHVKLSTAEENIDTIIINGAECEPYITANQRLMTEKTERVAEGIQVLRRLFPKAHTVIAIERNKPDAIQAVKKGIGQLGAAVSVLPEKYPQGSEKQLIYTLTGRRVPHGGLPKDVGCLVVNVNTVTAIAEAVLYGHPLTEKIITVSGNAICRPGNYAVRIGTTFSDVLAAAGGMAGENGRVIAGGPMMGTAVRTVDMPVLKTTAAILAFKNENEVRHETACIRCGRCVAVCPMRLRPLMLDGFIRRGDQEGCLRESVFACIECGCCAYVCPAGRQLVQSIRWGKQKIKNKQPSVKRRFEHAECKADSIACTACALR